MKHVCVLGEGAWGTAVSTLLSNNGLNVNLWCYNSDVAEKINKEHKNERYLPGVKLDTSIVGVADIKAALDGVDWIFEAIPVQFLRSIYKLALPFCKPDQKWVLLSKGVESETLLFPGQMLNDVFKKNVEQVVLAGPSFAKDLAQKNITGVTVASAEKGLAAELQGILNNSYFITDYSDDVTGVETGAALKNVLAIGVGMILGAGFAENTKALLFTKGFEEITRLAVAMGSKRETMCGLSGIGDMVLTCMGGQSRNVKTGSLLGAGWSLDKILTETGMIPEGINTVKSTHALSKKYNCPMPVCKGIYDVVFGGLSIEDFLKTLVVK
ncbi:NAD(P)-dependent glycerol-3-phosphate dehydrogenase [bacterium]|jgi:glycerol-3-phosphate dehydrogenase (NAD(P)+)|nr:NAD(P)-dependent glycerol-3-phosphate dehydrogenase [bacterium]